MDADAKIFLADQRGVNETEWFRSYNTFNFGKYYQESKQPFGDLYVCNEDTLDGKRSLSMLVEDYSYIIIVPIIGAVNYTDSSNHEALVAAGQVLVVEADRGASFTIANPFNEELVNFLQLWVKREPATRQQVIHAVTYDVNETIDQLVNIKPVGESLLPIKLSIGKFNGRGEAVYSIAPQKTVFLFVIEGAFEVAGRLLHARDGLALTNHHEVDMEALSNDAIILLLELSAS